MTGGGSGSDYFSSTELLTKGANEWHIIPNSLPARMRGLGSISVNNQIIIIGET